MSIIVVGHLTQQPKGNTYNSGSALGATNGRGSTNSKCPFGNAFDTTMLLP